MREILALWVLILSGCALTGNAQDQSVNIPATLFYVTSVGHSTNPAECEARPCTAITYRVEGYIKSQQDERIVDLVLTCNEHTAIKPAPHRLDICARVHAGKSYMIDLQSETVSFLHSGLNKAFEVDYKIESEKETPGIAGSQAANAMAKQARRSPAIPQHRPTA
jgi:hypothetical protein